MRDGRADSVKPGAFVRGSRSGEGGARKLLSIETIWADSRVILAFW